MFYIPKFLDFHEPCSELEKTLSLKGRTDSLFMKTICPIYQKGMHHGFEIFPFALLTNITMI